MLLHYVRLLFLMERAASPARQDEHLDKLEE